MVMEKKLTERKKAAIRADLNSQRLDVRLGLITQTEWSNRVRKSVALGVEVPSDWLK